MAVAERTSIIGRGFQAGRETLGKIYGGGVGIINQIKPFGSGVKPKLGPTGGGYQPYDHLGGGGSSGPTWGEKLRAGQARANAGWAKRYHQGMDEAVSSYKQALRRAAIDRDLRPGISWQPWKDPKRGFGGGRLPPSPTLTPLQGAQQGAKQGARKVGQKVIGAAGSKILGKGIAVVPIIGQGLIAVQTGFELGKTIAETINAAERKIWEAAGYVPPLGDNGVTSGTTEELPEEPPPAPIPPEYPVPVPYGESFTDSPSLTTNDSRTGWYKLRIDAWATQTEQIYNLNIPSRTKPSFSQAFEQSTRWAWVRGPRRKFVDYMKYFQLTGPPLSWFFSETPYIAGTGFRVINPNRLDDPPLFPDANPSYRPRLFGSEPQLIRFDAELIIFTASGQFDEYYFGDRRWRGWDTTVSIRWYNEDGTEEGGGELPAPVPKRKRREEDDDVTDCPNIRPLLMQQTALIEAKLTQQTADVTNIVAGLQAEVSANNQNVINAVNDVSADLAVDLTDVKNRLGPQIPDGISTKVSNHYDEFKNFLGQTWDNTKGTWDDFMTKFQEFSEKFDKLMKWLHIDRILNILIFITTVHNAYMLSANLTQTLISALNTITTVAGNALGLRDVEDAPIDFTEAINDTMENVLKGILGAENLENMKAEWKKYSRIYQAASHIMFAIQSINNSILGAVELVASNVSKIGNALKKWGAVSEKAYAWMNPTPWFQNKFFTTIESLEDAGGTIDMVALETLSAQQEVSQLITQVEDFQKMAAQLDDAEEGTGSPEAMKIKAVEDAGKAASSGVIE